MDQKIKGEKMVDLGSRKNLRTKISEILDSKEYPQTLSRIQKELEEEFDERGNIGQIRESIKKLEEEEEIVNLNENKGGKGIYINKDRADQIDVTNIF